MSEDKPGARPRARGGGSLFWWGVIAGFGVMVLVFSKLLLGLLRDAFANILPLFFTPGLLEITLAAIGFAIVIAVNYWLWRKEGKDEWVEIPDDED